MITKSTEILLGHIKTTTTDEEINSLLAVKKTVILHVGKIDHLRKVFSNCQYEFFNYTNIDEDNWGGLFMRVNHLAIQKAVDLIIFDFERVDMINQSELQGIEMQTKSIILYPAFPASFISSSLNFIETLSQSENGRRPMTTKNISAKAKEIITKLLRV